MKYEKGVVGTVSEIKQLASIGKENTYFYAANSSQIGEYALIYGQKALGNVAKHYSNQSIRVMGTNALASGMITAGAEYYDYQTNPNKRPTPENISKSYRDILFSTVGGGLGTGTSVLGGTIISSGLDYVNEKEFKVDKNYQNSIVGGAWDGQLGNKFGALSPILRESITKAYEKIIITEDKSTESAGK